MRAITTKGGIQTWINTRENSFIEQYFQTDSLLEGKSLSERELYIAQSLVSRGVLDKDVDQGKSSYKLNINRTRRN
jgi:hypothetical protein